MGVKIFNSLPTNIKKESNDIKKFESLLRKFYSKTLFIHWMNSTISHKDASQLPIVLILLLNISTHCNCI